MNRNIEWERLVNEVKGGLPARLERSAERAVSRMNIKRNVGLFVTAPAAFFCILFAVFATCANISGRFASTAKNIPFIGSFARLVTISTYRRN